MSTVTKRGLGSIDEEIELRRGPWTLEEDSLLIHYITCHGEGRWNMLAKSAGLKRTGKSCRLRWLNYLKPDIKRGNLTPQEQLLILELHSKWGNRWSKIAQHLPGRTDNEIKNYWRTRVQKQARQLNIESGSQRFMDAVRCLWMPRLLQKMEQNSSSSSSSLTDMNFENSAEAEAEASMLPISNVPSLPPPCPRELTYAANHSSYMSNPSNFCPDSLQFPQIQEIAENPTIAPFVLEKNAHCNPVQESWFMNPNSYGGMEGLNMEPLSIMEAYDISQVDFQTAESDWFPNTMGDALWNLDAM